jgi:hypothetical protein
MAAGPGDGEVANGGDEESGRAEFGAAVFSTEIVEDVGVAGGEGCGLNGVGEIQPAALPAGWARLLMSGAMRLEFRETIGQEWKWQQRKKRGQSFLVKKDSVAFNALRM